MKIKLENRQVAVYTAIILAFIMLFLPGASRNRYSFKPEQLAAAVTAGEDKVTSAELAEWIIQGRSDILVVDIRSDEDFAKGAIRNAVHIPLAQLLQRSTIDTALPETKTVILYSNGDSHAHQAWLVLKAAGVDAYVLQGGYNGWVASILNPVQPAGGFDDEILKYDMARSVAGSFGSSGAIKNQDAADKSGAAGDKPSAKPVIQPKKKKLGGCG